MSPSDPPDCPLHLSEGEIRNIAPKPHPLFWRWRIGIRQPRWLSREERCRLGNRDGHHHYHRTFTKPVSIPEPSRRAWHRIQAVRRICLASSRPRLTVFGRSRGPCCQRGTSGRTHFGIQNPSSTMFAFPASAVGSVCGLRDFLAGHAEHYLETPSDVSEARGSRFSPRSHPTGARWSSVA